MTVVLIDPATANQSATQALTLITRVRESEDRRELVARQHGLADWNIGGPAGGPEPPTATLHMTEVQYDPGPGATILIWIEGIVGLREELNTRREQVRVWGARRSGRRRSRTLRGERGC